MSTPVELNPERPQEPHCWLNGEFVSVSSARVPIDDPSFLRGEGLFETIRVHSGAPVLLERHWARLERAGIAFGVSPPVPMSPESFGSVCRWLCRENSVREGKIRLTISNRSALATIEPIDAPELGRPRPLRLAVFPGRIHSAWPIAGAKSTSYAGWTAARAWAKGHGFDDAILANERGEVCETSRSNLFFATGSGAYVTPPAASGLLPGVAREAIIESIRRETPADLHEAPLPLIDLRAFPAAFATNVVRGVQPIGAIAFDDGREVELNPNHPAIERAAALWNGVLQGEGRGAKRGDTRGGVTSGVTRGGTLDREDRPPSYAPADHWDEQATPV